MGLSDKKRFSIISRIKSANHAWRGIMILVKTGHNFWGHLFFATLVVYLGIILSITAVEWVLLVLSMVTVLITETVNTALEIDMDLTSPEYHPYARDTKDVSAGAVLLSILGAIIVGIIIFLPKILAL